MCWVLVWGVGGVVVGVVGVVVCGWFLLVGWWGGVG